MLGPIFSIEMITGSRRARLFIIRALYSVVLLVALWLAYAEAMQSAGRTNLAQAANTAAEFFTWFSIIQLSAVVLVGPALAASTIAVERERRTIEYLFATDLTNHEIILGKLVSQLIQIGYIILAGLPVLACAMLMGGIAPEQLFAVTAITLSSLITVTVFAVTVSVWSPRVRDAILRVYLILFAVLFLPGVMVPFFLRGANLFSWLITLNELLLSFNPFAALANALRTSRGGASINWDSVWKLIVSQAIITISLGCLATNALRRVHLRESGKAPKVGKFRKTLLRKGPSEFPMIWKEMVTAKSAHKLGWAGRIAMGIILLSVLGSDWYWFFYFSAKDGAIATIVITVFLGCGMLLLLAARGASAITSEKEKDTWITLLSTALSGREIIVAKIVGNLYAGRGVLVLLAILWGAQCLRTPLLIAAVPFLVVSLIIFALFVTMVGILYSLRSRNSIRAIGATLATTLFIGGGYLFCFIPLLTGTNDSEIVLTAFIPFLLMFPGMIVIHGHPPHEAMYAAYFFGLIAYTGGGAVIFATIAECLNDRNKYAI